MSNQPPVDKKRCGKVVVCEWQGEKFNSYTFEYNWKDKEGNWQSSKSIPAFALQDLVGASQSMLVKTILSPDKPKPVSTPVYEPTIPPVQNPLGKNEDEEDSLPF